MKYPGLHGEILECNVGFIPEELIEMTTKAQSKNNKKQIDVTGCFYVPENVSDNQFLDELVEFAESKGYEFLGVTKENKE